VSAETIGATLDRAAARLAAAGVAPARTEAVLLLAHLLETDRGGVLVRRREALPSATATRFAGFVERRARREPLQHVTGIEEFCGLTLGIDARALVPRPETEGLVEAALGLALPPGPPVADLGTGSGCIAVALAVRRPDLRVHALDLCPEALSLARENAARHGVERRIDFVRGDFAVAPAAWHGRMSVVLSNPPYVSEAEWTALEPEVRDHDPRLALVAGPTGTEAYAALLPAALELLVRGGWIVLELGFGQAERVRALAQALGYRDVEVRPDWASIPRVLVARRG
jgi:release factor glutamine methyltransferase